jgi:uncharacterized lipoprotein YmbA
MPASPLLRAAALAASAALAACASAPTHFYTLLQSGAPRSAPVASPAFLIDVEPVAVPAQVDQAELLVRQSEQRVAVLDSERWAAPLAAELREAFAADLAADLGTRDVHGLAHPPATPLFRVRIDVRRFDSWPDRHALIAADWSILGADAVRVTCTSTATETVAAGYDALVQGHQRALATISDDIAAAVRAMAGGATPPACPR